MYMYMDLDSTWYSLRYTRAESIALSAMCIAKMLSIVSTKDLLVKILGFFFCLQMNGPKKSIIDHKSIN